MYQFFTSKTIAVTWSLGCPLSKASYINIRIVEFRTGVKLVFNKYFGHNSFISVQSTKQTVILVYTETYDVAFVAMETNASIRKVKKT